MQKKSIWRIITDIKDGLRWLDTATHKILHVCHEIGVKVQHLLNSFNNPDSDISTLFDLLIPSSVGIEAKESIANALLFALKEMGIITGEAISIDAAIHLLLKLLHNQNKNMQDATIKKTMSIVAAKLDEGRYKSEHYEILLTALSSPHLTNA